MSTFLGRVTARKVDRVRRLILLVVVSACNQVLGLDATQPLDAYVPLPDQDRDSIPDDRDNCIDVANADQLDTDGDSRGDACDGCAFCLACDRGPDHDEDGDQIPDGCDNCPAYANAGQENADGDDLGDACDPLATPQRRLRFDGFATLDPDWLQGGAPWKIVEDTVAPDPGIPSSSYQLQSATVQIPRSSDWFIEIGVLPVAGDAQGIHLTVPPSFLSCDLDTAGPAAWRIINTGITDSVPLALSGIARLRFTAQGPPSSQMFACEVVGTHRVDFGPIPIMSAGTINLYTTAKARFAYIDIVGP